jgi:hypothetical protein
MKGEGRPTIGGLEGERGCCEISCSVSGRVIYPTPCLCGRMYFRPCNTFTLTAPQSSTMKDGEDNGHCTSASRSRRRGPQKTLSFTIEFDNPGPPGFGVGGPRPRVHRCCGCALFFRPLLLTKLGPSPQAVDMQGLKIITTALSTLSRPQLTALSVLASYFGVIAALLGLIVRSMPKPDTSARARQRNAFAILALGAFGHTWYCACTPSFLLRLVDEMRPITSYMNLIWGLCYVIIVDQTCSRS